MKLTTTSEQLKAHYRSQADLLLRVGRTGLEFCEKSVEANAATVRQLLSIPIPESANQNNATEMAVAGGKIAVAHWSASYVRAIEFQRQILATFVQNRG